MYNLLIVDDDQALLQVNQIYFSHLGFKVYQAENAKEALKIIETMALDCIVLDVELPDESGFDLCNKVKEKSNIPIIFLSNHAEEEKRIGGFLAGGDDYLTKPYSLKELELRIYSRIKHNNHKNTTENLLCFGKLAIDANARAVSYEEHKISLTAAEFDILWFLAKRENKVFSQREIYEKVWKMPDLGDAHTVQVHIAQMRKKINSFSTEHCYIQTVWGKGYKFVSFA